jgi:glycerate-2-kinase
MAALALIESAGEPDTVLALISGGASALVEQPRQGLRFDEMRDRVQALMASGAPIHELNRLRTELSAIKGGKLAARSKAPVITLVVSDVIGDDPRVIGSGPTVREPAHDGDRVEVVAPMSSFGVEIFEALAARGIEATRIAEPIAGDVVVVADRLVAELGGGGAMGAGGRANRGVDATGVEGNGGADDIVLVAWGEPTVRVVENAGSGGRAQQLALELAKRLRGTGKSAFVAGSDGVDGPSARGAAGAFVEGTTWDAIAAAGIDPAAALARCDAGTALDAVGALVVTGPTGINHADVVIIG